MPRRAACSAKPPAAADFQHAHAGPQVQGGQDMGVLGFLRIVQREVGVAGKQCRGVRPRVVEPECVERIAQIIVRVDIAPAAAARVPSQQMTQLVPATRQPGPGDGARQRGLVADGQAQQRGHVGAVDPRVAPGFGKADIAGAQDLAARAPVPQRQTCAGRGMRIAKDRLAAVWQREHQMARGQASQHGQECAGQQWHVALAGTRQGARTEGGTVHGRMSSSGESGTAGAPAAPCDGGRLPWNGTPRHHSRNACQ